ncbi:GNAT family N-acetyltransferase [Streptomyces sp. NPDC006326]|uniref:GNAT family N-acetyltransferase n=1 Tax=Streptomyces sp. NPDC006326 TaxID=3156752 RepID=UPI0033A64B82
MPQPITDRRNRTATLEDVTPADDQRHAEGEVVGHVMGAYDDEGGTHWIGGLVVNESEQGKGAWPPPRTAARSASRTTRSISKTRRSWPP